MHHAIDWIAHTTAFVTPVMELWLECEIATMRDRSDDISHHGQFLQLSYIKASFRWRNHYDTETNTGQERTQIYLYTPLNVKYLVSRIEQSEAREI